MAERKTMQWSFGVVVSLVVALALGMAFIHRAGAPPASTPISVSAPPRAPGTEVSSLGTSDAEETGATAIVGGNTRPAETPPQDITALREEVALLKAQVSTFERWIHTQRRAVPSVPSRRAADLAPDPRTDPAARATAERARQHQMAVVEAIFQREAADARWAMQAEEAVQAALASDDIIQNTLVGLECRSQTCRVELADDDSSELAKVLPVVLLQLAPTLPSATMHYVADSAGGRNMILYLSREAPEPPPPGK